LHNRKNLFFPREEKTEPEPLLSVSIFLKNVKGFTGYSGEKVLSLRVKRLKG
jgi:hypothetical protein